MIEQLTVSQLATLPWCLIVDNVIHVADYIPIDTRVGNLRTYTTDYDGELVNCDFSSLMRAAKLHPWNQRSTLPGVVCPDCELYMLQELRDTEEAIINNWMEDENEFL